MRAVWGVCGVVLCLLLAPVLREPPSARADDATILPPTVAPLASYTPLPTPAAEPSPTSTLVVVREQPTVTIVVPSPAPFVSAVPTRTSVTEFTALPTPYVLPTPVPPTVTPAPVPVATTTSQGPSPDELRQSAGLRWGKHVPPAVRRWAFLIVPIAKRYHLKPNLIAAVMTLESGGDPNAWNQSSDARGLMQVLHGPWDPAANIDLGARMLAGFYQQFGDWTLTFAAYNAGPNAVLTYGGVPPYRETQDYVVVVNYLWSLYSHRKLTVRQKSRYRATLKDLEHFPKERAKVKRLVRIHVAPSEPALSCARSVCGDVHAPSFFPTLDPYWPVGSAPDPLQRVDLYQPPG